MMSMRLRAAISMGDLRPDPRDEDRHLRPTLCDLRVGRRKEYRYCSIARRIPSHRVARFSSHYIQPLFRVCICRRELH